MSSVKHMDDLIFYYLWHFRLLKNNLSFDICSWIGSALCFSWVKSANVLVKSLFGFFLLVLFYLEYSLVSFSVSRLWRLIFILCPLKLWHIYLAQVQMTLKALVSCEQSCIICVLEVSSIPFPIRFWNCCNRHLIIVSNKRNVASRVSLREPMNIEIW